MRKNLNEVICEVLNSVNIITSCDDTTTELDFMPSENELGHIVELKDFDLINTVKSQTIEIYTFEYFGEDKQGNPDTSENCVEIFLSENEVALRYLTNAGLSEDASCMIMQIIANFTQKNWYLTYGKDVIKTFKPISKDKLNIYL